MERIDIEGLSIAYQRSGVGPPLVLVHGYVGDAWSTWRHQLEVLSENFTVVAPDLPGAGASADPPEDFGITGYADFVARFAEALHLGPVHLVGLSFGGNIAIEVARRHPRLVTTLVLASAYAGWYGSLPADVADRRLQQAIKLSTLDADELVSTLLPTMFASAPAAADVEAFRTALLAFHPSGFRVLARACAEDVRAALPEINAPTLLIYGGRDERAPLYVANQLHDAIPGSVLVVLPEAGHVCSVEAPAEFNRELRVFLTRHAKGRREY